MNTSISELEPVASNDETNENNGVASTDETYENNGVASKDESDGCKGITSNDEGNEIDRKDKENEFVSNENSRKKDTDKRVIDISAKHQEKDINRSKKKTTKEVPVRRSERVRKQIYNIHPDDIGNNDDEDDENYK